MDNVNLSTDDLNRLRGARLLARIERKERNRRRYLRRYARRAK